MARRMAGHQASVHPIAPPYHTAKNREWHFGGTFSLKLKRHQCVVIKNMDGVSSASCLGWISIPQFLIHKMGVIRVSTLGGSKVRRLTICKELN